MKILFIGPVRSSLMALSKLLEMNAHIVGVVTKKDSPYNADFAPLCHKKEIF